MMLMSTLSVVLKAEHKIMGNKLLDIYVGWINFLTDNDEVRELAEERLKICDECKDDKGEPMVIYAIKPVSLYLHCRKCICHIPSMVRSPEKVCPIDNW